MPYNNTAIPPPDEVTGSAALPLSRVKRILQLDEDIIQCSNNAAFVVTVATVLVANPLVTGEGISNIVQEMFVRYLAEQAHNVVKSERKPRKNIQYKDLANAVARIDNLEFLSDVIPRTQTYKQYKEKKAKEAANGVSIEPGQTTLDSRRTAVNGTSEIVGLVDEKEANGAMPDVSVAETQERPKDTRPAQMNGELIFKHYHANGGHHQEIEDVEMQ